MSKDLQFRKVFVFLFNFGLGLLILDFISKYAQQYYDNFFSYIFNSIPLFAIGFILCLISIPFLMVEWLTLPLGTFSKRVRLYKVIGKFSALIFLSANWFWRDNTNFSINESASLTFFSSFLLLTVFSGWLSGQFAALISKKRISAERFDFMNPKSLRNAEKIKTEKTNRPISAGELIKSGSAAPVVQNQF